MTGAGTVALAGVGGLGGRALLARQDVGAARRAVRLPAPVSRATAIPAGAQIRVQGMTPFVTPNKDFYRVDKDLTLPQVDPRQWRLRIHGMVAHPVELSFDDLLKRPMMERDMTLTCVSNEVGGTYAGNARWLGASLTALLRAAGVRAGADQILSRSADGITISTPIETVMDGRDALLAVGMNGEALPVAHGFPARVVVPGLYGYVSATKWIVDLKVTRFATDQAYWTERGYAERAPIKTLSRIDVPRPFAQVRAGRVAVAGTAWAQHRGIDAVEVRVDGGPWKRGWTCNGTVSYVRAVRRGQVGAERGPVRGCWCNVPVPMQPRAAARLRSARSALRKVVSPGRGCSLSTGGCHVGLPRPHGREEKPFPSGSSPGV